MCAIGLAELRRKLGAVFAGPAAALDGDGVFPLAAGHLHLDPAEGQRIGPVHPNMMLMCNGGRNTLGFKPKPEQMCFPSFRERCDCGQHRRGCDRLLC